MNLRRTLLAFVTMLSVLRHLNYKPWFALAEFVDNSLQSYEQNKQALRNIDGQTFRLRVEIEISRIDAAIVVRDNAAGIGAIAPDAAFRARAER